MFNCFLLARLNALLFMQIATILDICDKETKQNWTGAENFDNWFCVNFDRYQKDLISGTKTGHQALSKILKFS